MSFIDLFPTVIFQTHLDNINNFEIEEYKNNIAKEEFNFNFNNGKFTKNQKLLDNFVFLNIKNSILKYSRNYLDNLHHEYEDIQISSSWGTHLSLNESSSPHFHSNSYISGVFYLTKGSPIIFHNNQLSNFTYTPGIKNIPHTYQTTPIYKVNPTPNLLIIFPSWLPHSIEPSKLDNRMSIAFNIIPKGEFGVDTQKLYL